VLTKQETTVYIW